MKRVHIDRAVVLVLMVMALGAGTICAAEQPDELQLINTLESTASLQQKDAACAQLKRVGTTRCVPVLAALLPDKDLSHTARYALESMQAPEAGKALTSALGETSGLIKAGIILSLKVRHETGATGDLVKSLDDPDPNVAAAAAAALGNMEPAQASRPLAASLAKTSDASVRNAIQNALLASAYGLLAQGKSEEAAAIFEKLLAPSGPDHIRTAAYRGAIASASPDKALKLVTTALEGKDGRIRQAAIQMARELKSPRATSVLCDVLPRLTTATQAALIGAISQRGDTAAAPALIAMTRNPDPLVRITALGALADLGDSTAAAPLTKALASTNEDERKTAYRALLDLRRGNVAESLVDQMEKSTPEVQEALARILTERHEKTANPALFQLARTGNSTARGAAIQSLSHLAQVSDVPALVRLVVQSKDANTRTQAGSAVLAACVGMQSNGATVDVAPIVTAFSGGNSQVRIALLPTTSALKDARLHDALRNALKATEPSVHDAAVKSLCDARDFELMPDLLALAKGADIHLNVQAIQSCLRLATGNTTPSLNATQRTEALEQILSVAQRPDEKWAVLSSLAQAPNPKALQLAMPMLDDTATRAEAVQAVTKIADAIRATNREEARDALTKVLSVATDPEQRKTATKALDQITTGTGSPQ